MSIKPLKNVWVVSEKEDIRNIHFYTAAFTKKQCIVNFLFDRPTSKRWRNYNKKYRCIKVNIEFKEL